MVAIGGAGRDGWDTCGKEDVVLASVLVTHCITAVMECSILCRSE